MDALELYKNLAQVDTDGTLIERLESSAAGYYEWAVRRIGAETTFQPVSGLKEQEEGMYSELESAIIDINRELANHNPPLPQIDLGKNQLAALASYIAKQIVRTRT
ncbi:MAG: hypothetical protein WC595_02375 [Candidatus Nanoarchaeia archaeon]